MSVREINPKETGRASAFELWMKAPNPMVTFFKTYDVMPLIAVSKHRGMKFHMLLNFCIGRAAASIKEFYLLPVGSKLMQYDKIAVSTIVANKEGAVNSCAIAYTDALVCLVTITTLFAKLISAAFSSSNASSASTIIKSYSCVCLAERMIFL